jgi:hypothetical protein
MQRILSALVVCLLASGSVEARPAHWYTDWKTIAGLAAIAGSLYADGKSTCTGYGRGLVEGGALGSGTHNCAAAIGVLSAAGIAYGGIHIWLRNEAWNETSRPWQIFERVGMPAIACAVHCSIAAHNYQILPPR